MQHWAQTVALAAALIAILVGLGGHWSFWAVVERAVGAYLVVFGVVGVLLYLGRSALRAEPDPPSETRGNDPERPGTGGTDSAA